MSKATTSQPQSGRELDERARDPLVVFAGAGVSAVPPSNLPTWTEFNDRLLERLCDQVERFSDGRQPTDQMLAAFRARRDGSQFLTPDFQAQLMEEEVGADYFRVWQSLDAGSHGPVHAAIAELAARGRLRAVVTTNFDRLIEAALEARGHPFEVFHDAASFGSLSETLASPGEALPVIKIHGSIEDAPSLVDTLRQRVAGRPQPLVEALGALLRESRWLFVGFSGADFAHDPHYLGILDAADEAQGFVFLAREGREVHEGVRLLADAYGARATIEHGDMAPWLQATFGLDPGEAAGDLDGRDAALERVAERIGAWAEELGPIAVTNILCAMLKSSGLENQAWWLMRKTWKSYRRPEDTSGSSYDRYNLNYGISLLENGLIANPVALEEDMSNLSEWKRHADQNAFEFLARSYREGDLPAAGARLASLLAYRGEVGRAIALSSDVIDEALAREDGLVICEVALACVPIHDIVRLQFEHVIPWLARCSGIAERMGDEPRRALLSAHLARFVTAVGAFDEAERLLDDAERIGRRLDLHDVEIACRAGRGRLLVDRGESDDEAVELLRAVASDVRERDEEPLVVRYDLGEPDAPPEVLRGLDPALCRILLDLLRAARFAGDAGVMNETLDELEDLTVERFLGYLPHYYLAYAEALLHHGEGEQLDLAAELVDRARRVGEEMQNPWVATAADALERLTADRS